MRPLIVVLHARSERALSSAARFWDLPATTAPAELVGALYPILTDAWQLALGIERIGPLAHAMLRTVANYRTPLSPAAIAAALAVPESIVIGTARQLYIAGILASESTDQGPQLFLPNELARLVLRLERERNEPLVPETALPTLLDRLTDHELLEMAERYGVRIVPTVTTRHEAARALLEVLERSETLRTLQTNLSPAARALFEFLLRENRPVPLRDILARSRSSFGELRRSVSELARWGAIWRTSTNDQLAVVVPRALVSLATPTGLRALPEAVDPLDPSPGWTTLVDLLLFLARRLDASVATNRSGARSAAAAGVERNLPSLRSVPLGHDTYLDFLERLTRSLGLLRSDGTVDPARLRSWLQLSFAEQARRLLRTWRSLPDSQERTRRHRLLEQCKALEPEVWYEWSSLSESAAADEKRQPERLAQELEWLGLLARGRTASGWLAVRVTAWGQWMLELTEHPPALRLALTLRIAGCPDLLLANLFPAVVWLIARLGEPERIGSTLVWKLTAERVARYVQWSARTDAAPREPEKLAAAVLRQLERAFGQTLPGCWSEAVRALFAHNRPALVRPALVLRLVSEADRERAQQALQARSWTVIPIGPAELLITDWEPRQRAQLVAALRRAGFLVDWPEEARASRATVRRSWRRRSG